MKVSIIDWIIKKLKRCIAIVEEGNTASQAIGSGKYVMWKGNLYTADTAISSGTTLAASGGSKNLTAVADGGYNDLNGKISTLNSKITKTNDRTTGMYINGNDDLDNYNTGSHTGLYSIGGTAPAHCPSTWCQLMVIARPTSGVLQMLFHENWIKVRRRTGSPLTWTEWQTVLIYDTGWVTVKKDGDNSYFKYRKCGNMVTIYGFHKVSSATITAWSNYSLGAIPNDMKPAFDMSVRANTDRSSSSGVGFSVGTNGNVYFRGMYCGASDTSDVLTGLINYTINE